jgi:hypothetical protein
MQKLNSLNQTKIIMKKFYTLLLLSFMGLAQAQVPNSSFEETIGYAGDVVRYWGHVLTLSASIDTTGTVVEDIILFDEGNIYSYTQPVTDPHTGERAMEITNAYNQTNDLVIAGAADLINEAVSVEPTGWNNGITLPENATVNMLGFYYKFFPLGDDVAQATLEIFNADSESIGTAVIDISGTASEYTYIAQPIDFTITDTPVFMTISFTMAKPGSVPVFGSRLLVDDIAVNNATMGIKEQQAALFSVYPTITDGILTISKNDRATDTDFTITIIDLNGKTVDTQVMNTADRQVNVSNLANGLYFLKATNDSGVFTTKFIKK